MKKNALLQILLIALFATSCNAAYGQGDYVVTLKGDTLWGKVRYYSNSGNSSKYVQLTPAQGKKSTHEVLKTISFRMNDEVYHTIQFEQGYTFMKLLLPGYLSLYGHQAENQTNWSTQYLVKKGGSFLAVPNIGFKKRVSQFLEDCPAVANEVEAGISGKTEILKIVNDYNACTALKTNPQPAQKSPGIETWASLATKVKALPDFDKKPDALEMIREIQNKVSANETVPAFIINGLKDALQNQAGIKEKLEEALATLAN